MLKIKFLLFYIIIIYILPKVKLIKYFKAYNLEESEDILIISDEGIIKYNIDSEYKEIITLLNFTIEDSTLEFIDFAQYTSYEGGYIFCRVDKYLFIIDNSLVYIETINEIEEKYISITPYKSKNNNYYCIINYINNDKQIKTLSYKINFESTYSIELIIDKIQDYNENNISLYLNITISCELMYYSNYENYLLVCFVKKDGIDSIVAIAFNPENYMNIVSTTEKIDNSDIYYIKSTTNNNKKICLICFHNYYSPFKCVIYNSEIKSWSNTIILKSYYLGIRHDYNVNYINSNKEYWIYLSVSYKEYIYFRFDENFNIKDNNEGQKCYFDYDFADLLDFHTIPISSCMIFNNNKYYLFLSINENGNYNFTVSEIEENCKMNVDFEQFNISSFQFLSSNILHHSSSILSSSLIKSSSEVSSFVFSSLPSYSSIKSVQNSEIFLPSTLLYSKNYNYINIIYEGDIIFGKMSKTKEEIVNNLKEFMEIIDLEKKYLIYGNDYNITISPIKEIQIFNSTYADLSLCEEILREKYKLSSNEIMIILQIEINRIDEKVLTNKIEYAIYNQKKEKLDLSYCKNLDITIHYDIIEVSSLNKTMISYYSDLGIDILNIKDSFFNDICYPFSNSNSDIILKDRISDIYQNYSLCEPNCEYNHSDIESNSVTCICQIKTEINTEIEPPVFSTIVIDTFKNSNFGVLKCYNLIFSSQYILNNLGFWIFLFFTICHIPIFIHYCIKGLNSIILFNKINKNNKKSDQKNENNI